MRRLVQIVAVAMLLPACGGPQTVGTDSESQTAASNATAGTPEWVHPDHPFEGAIAAAVSEPAEIAFPIAEKVDPATCTPVGTASTRQADADRVYGRLLTYVPPRRRPRLTVAVDTGEPAVFLAQGRKRIQLDAAVVDVCRQLGERSDDCLAFVLGHELSHADHGDVRRMKLAADHSKSSRVDHTRQDLEALADYQAGVYGYLSGFDSTAVGGQALARLYACFGLASNATGYLPLEDRQRQAAKAHAEVLATVAAFDAANFMMALGRFGLARAVHYSIYEEMFAAREVLNNAAVASLAAAQSLVHQGLVEIDRDGSRVPEKPFEFPFQVDLDTRIEPSKLIADLGKLRGTDEEKTRRAAATIRYVQLLEDAVQDLEQLVETEPKYSAGLVNLAVALTMRNFDSVGDSDRAAELLDRAESLIGDTRPETSADIAVVRAIALARSEDVVGALKTLEAVADKRPLLAKTNRAVIAGETATKAPEDAEMKFAWPDSPEVTAEFWAARLAEKRPISAHLTLGDGSHVVVARTSTPGWDALLVTRDDGESVLLVTALAGNRAAVNEVRPGINADDVLAKLGDPARRVSTPDGVLYAYGELLVRISSGRVATWTRALHAPRLPRD